MNYRKLNGFLKQKLIDGKVNSKILSCVILPDYSTIAKLEIEKKNLEDNYRIISDCKPWSTFFIPKYYLHMMYLKKKLREVDYEIDKEITKQLKGSKTAFVCIESLTSISYLKKALE